MFEWSLCKCFINDSISIHSFLLQVVCIDGEVVDKLFFAQLHPMLFYLDCQPMKKLYYLQYQYMPFFVASMAVLLYMPYVLFRIINTDMVSLRTTLGKGNVSSHLHVLRLSFTLQQLDIWNLEYESFQQLFKLANVRGVFRTQSNSTMELFLAKMVNG